MTRLSRRQFGIAAATAPLAAAAVTAGTAQAAAHSAARPAVYDASLGNYRITAILDGIAPLGREMFFGPEPAVIDAALADAGVGPDMLIVFS